ncbi:response regulator transcription factor [Shewanella oneidensis MR-1]|uniref:Two component signal transduction system response regulator LuxR family n=1 Tax=Shewanella oneidensis (strain ATCC 700550 / JCM 31522 / CIP 106686 / LMG 19005 / NCIMB 14063 / MR-1) TaxID=211586 RepID=Q8EJV5_SHEON|nr:response regulator transcription factor [Shewanella oneidensis]AAN53436.1 two component signal transduction system response regulator LuxR family [Shewanella oneidensis MR-1]MDX5997697.1 response regulator transcription factor [Shewanella oneidensis]MEE2027045.1 Transcriptional regulatory protein DesR [Shewanella oneidensis]QKG95285.1 response regulator transcription factor [Shewanella oneidensis MR-1]
MKILLAEDQAMVRGALAALLTLAGGFTITQASDGDEALTLLKQQHFDLLLTDIEMPGRTGLELAAWLKEQHSQTKVVVITTFGRAGYIKRAIEAGVGGFLLKDAPSETLVSSIQQVMAGKRVIDPELAMMAIGDIDPLNDKERRALRFASEGKSTAEIADMLFIAEGTVRNYLSEAIAKLNASNRIDAARIAKQKGWL